MKIGKDSHVSLDYRLTLESGEVIEQSQPENPLEVVCGYNQIITGLEKGLMGHQEDDSFQVVVPPNEGYGEHLEEMVQEVPLDRFPENIELKVGMAFQSQTPQGIPVTFIVRKIENGNATVDLNHPMAGKTLIFDVTVQSVRAATQAEIDRAKGPASCDSGNPSGCGDCSCG